MLHKKLVVVSIRKMGYINESLIRNYPESIKINEKCISFKVNNVKIRFSRSRKANVLKICSNKYPLHQFTHSHIITNPLYRQIMKMVNDFVTTANNYKFLKKTVHSISCRNINLIDLNELIGDIEKFGNDDNSRDDDISTSTNSSVFNTNITCVSTPMQLDDDNDSFDSGSSNADFGSDCIEDGDGGDCVEDGDDCVEDGDERFKSTNACKVV